MRVLLLLVAAAAVSTLGYPLRGANSELDAALSQSPALLSVVTKLREGTPAERILELLDSIIERLEDGQTSDAEAYQATHEHCENEAESFRREFNSAQTHVKEAEHGISTARQTIEAKEAQMAALAKEVEEAEKRIGKAEETLSSAEALHKKSLETYERNRNQVAEAKRVVQAILAHLQGAQVEATSFVELEAHLRRAGLHKDADEVKSLAPDSDVSVADAASELQEKMEREARALLGDQEEAESLVHSATGVAAADEGTASSALVHSATGAAAEVPAMVEHPEAQHIVDLVMRLLSRLEEAEAREEKQQEEAARTYREFADKIEAEMKKHSEAKEAALDKKREAAGAKAHAEASLDTFRGTVTEAQKAFDEAKASLESAEGVCESYAKEYEARTEDRRADIEAAKTIRTLVKEKLHGIMMKLQHIMDATGAAAEGFVTDDADYEAAE